MATESTQRLVSDLKVLARDTQDLIKETAEQTSERANAAREKARQTLTELQGSIQAFEESALQRARAAAAATEDYVRENPWRSLGAAATVAIIAGVLAGILLGRR